MSLDWLYSFDELRAYSLDTKQGKARLETLLKQLPSILDAAGVKLPPRPKVLCLMAGSCIEGIALAQLYNAEVFCLDLQKGLLAKGQKEARRRKLALRTIVGDVKEFARHVEGRFDLITIMGSPLPHLNIYDFDEVLAQVRKLLAKKGFFLIDQTDMVFRIIPQYRDAFVPNLKPPVLNVHYGFNPREGYFERLYYSRSRHETVKVYLWTPWVIGYMLKKNGFGKVEVKPYVDMYTVIQTHLFTATL